MNLSIKKLWVALLLFSSVSIMATHYINKTGKTIVITNVSAQKRYKKSLSSAKKRNKKNKIGNNQLDNQPVVHFITLENGQDGDLDNKQDDEITITSPGMNDKRKLFPSNNSFNYVVTMNKYKAMFERFDINHAE
ncbi:MAG: hypothetical protein JO129_01310 [Candidatus Dependentiae bacterium]|nr:hypothetical protein [Candidatus Dependentiae bacterium]